MRNLPATSCIAAFEAVARLGFISLAARELFVTPSALSHRLSLLEKMVGVRLFCRSSKVLTLTSAGQRYQNALGNVLDQIHAAATEARDRNGERSLGILVSEGFASLWLIPRLREFVELYPGVRIEIYSSSSLAWPRSPRSKHRESVHGQIDIEIRDGPVDQGDRVAEPLLFGACGVYVSVGAPEADRFRTFHDLRMAPLIRTADACLSWESWLASHKERFSPLSYALVTQTALLSLQAASAGIGLALECSDLAEPFVQSGLLVRVLQDSDASSSMGCRYLVYRQGHLERPSVRRFREWLMTRVQSEKKVGREST